MIKICGVTRPEDVRAAIDAGADAIGIVCCEGSPRTVLDPEPLLVAAESVIRVAVFRTWDGQELKGFDVVQAFDFRTTPPLPRLIAHKDADDLQLRTSPTPLGDALLDGPAGGGQGIAADASRAHALARRCRLVLAGGLTPHTVAAAIRTVRPAAVDVSSGVESTPGRKDPHAVRAFVTAARAALEES
ncbi:MAG: phosphoribosylanthranilate isomerase [Myxococcales bacterium]|nr:phosphoribosylanthranilate isomerase [Myxococcales bacterium]